MQQPFGRLVDLLLLKLTEPLAAAGMNTLRLFGSALDTPAVLLTTSSEMQEFDSHAVRLRTQLAYATSSRKHRCNLRIGGPRSNGLEGTVLQELSCR
jgi:hypothetical protein